VIKKGIASILTFLMLINSLGCYSYKKQSLKKESDTIQFDRKVKVNTFDGKTYTLTNAEIIDHKLRAKWGWHMKKQIFPTEEIKTITVNEYDGLITISSILGCAVLADKVKVTTLDEKVYYFTEVEVNGLQIKGKDQSGEVIINADEIKEFQAYEKNINATIIPVAALLGVGIAIYIIFTTDYYSGMGNN
jgi:hypothetical protein